jgi:hypothetical protein
MWVVLLRYATIGSLVRDLFGKIDAFGLKIELVLWLMLLLISVVLIAVHAKYKYHSCKNC